MIQKNPIHPQRIRKVPTQFSWVDHRLVRERYIESITHAAATLYLFLVIVADSQGMSYYSDGSITERLSMDSLTLEQARCNLLGAGLIAYRKPLYQVLSLDSQVIDQPSPARDPLKQPLPIGRIFKQMIGGNT
jgi:hypothetical protein